MVKRVGFWLTAAGVAAAALFVVALDKEYPGKRIDEWCSHARALRDAKLLDRAYVAFRTLHRADGACDARQELASLRFQIARREQLTEGARAFRRAADLQGRPHLTEGRRAAVRDAFAAYQDALELDPYAHGARRAFVRLVARYRAIEPEAPDCTRAQGVAAAGLLPEGRLYLSRALRTGDGGICRRGLESLGRRRAAAYQQLRVAEAREKSGDIRGAREAYAAALRGDSSERLALDGLARVEPSAIHKDGGWSRDFVDYLGNVKDVIPAAMQAFLAILATGLSIFTALWFGARGLARRSARLAWLVDRTWLRGAPHVHLQTEGTAELEPDVSGMVDDTLARLHTPSIDPRTGLIRSGMSVTPKGATAQVDEVFTAVEPLALAAQVVRLGTSKLRTVSDVSLVLEHAAGDGHLEQRWRVIDRRTRRTLVRVEIREKDLLVKPRDPRKRFEFFVILAGEELRAAILRAQRIRGELTPTKDRR